MKWWKWALIISGSVVILTGIGGVIGVTQFYQHGLQAVGGDTEKLITIESGATTREIAKQLESAGR